MSLPCGVPYPEMLVEDGVGAIPSISEIEAADLEEIFFAAMARARCL